MRVADEIIAAIQRYRYRGDISSIEVWSVRDFSDIMRSEHNAFLVTDEDQEERERYTGPTKPTFMGIELVENGGLPCLGFRILSDRHESLLGDRYRADFIAKVKEIREQVEDAGADPNRIYVHSKLWLGMVLGVGTGGIGAWLGMDVCENESLDRGEFEIEGSLFRTSGPRLRLRGD